MTLGAWGFSLSLSTDVGRVEPVDGYGDSDNFNFELTYPFRVLGGRELDVSAFLHFGVRSRVLDRRRTLDLWFLGYLKDRERRLIPGELSAGFGDFADVSRLNQASATLGAGYAYDWNITHGFFLSMLGSLGLAGSLLDLSFASSGEESTRALGFALGLQLAATYVSKGFHAGLVSGGVAESVTTHRVAVVSPAPELHLACWPAILGFIPCRVRARAG